MHVKPLTSVMQLFRWLHLFAMASHCLIIVTLRGWLCSTNTWWDRRVKAVHRNKPLWNWKTPWKHVFDVTSVGQRSSPWTCNSVKVEMRFRLECKLHFLCAESISIEAKYRVSWLRFDDKKREYELSTTLTNTVQYSNKLKQVLSRGTSRRFYSQQCRRILSRRGWNPVRHLGLGNRESLGWVQ